MLIGPGCIVYVDRLVAMVGRSVSYHKRVLSCLGQPGARRESVSASLAGRILSSRESSKKLVFYDVHGQGAKVQVVADKKEITDQGEVSNLRDSMKSVLECVAACVFSGNF